MPVSLGLYLLNCHLNEDEEYDTLSKGEFEVCIINVKWSLCRCVTAWDEREECVCACLCVSMCVCVFFPFSCFCTVIINLLVTFSYCTILHLCYLILFHVYPHGHLQYYVAKHLPYAFTGLFVCGDSIISATAWKRWWYDPIIMQCHCMEEVVV